ncbi:hypothetical protein HAX54_013939, partial [Datura stramonium]|nr:hypothetical protein [Datura stramonium]
MATSGASSSGSGEGAGGREFILTDLFGSSSRGNSTTDLNQPAPDSPNPGEPAVPPIAEPYHLVQEESILEKRHQIRGELFYPNGKEFSLNTYLEHFNQIENHGTHYNLPYRMLWQALDRLDLELVIDGSKKRRDCDTTIKEGDLVKRTGSIVDVLAGKAILGR